MRITKHKSGTIKRLLKIEESELEPYFKYYLGEVEFEALPEEQQIKLERFKKAWSWYVMGRTKQMIVDALKKDYNIKDRQAEYDLAASIFIHGRKEPVDKDGRRVASAEYFDLLSQLSTKEKKYDWAIAARKEADDCLGIHEKETDGLNPEDFLKPTKIIFNTKVDIHNYEKEKTIDLDE